MNYFDPSKQALKRQSTAKTAKGFLQNNIKQNRLNQVHVSSHRTTIPRYVSCLFPVKVMNPVFLFLGPESAAREWL